MAKGTLEMYATQAGVVAVRNPVKLQILHTLGESGASFEDIVSAVGRAKATVSVHLSDLRSQGIVKESGVDGDRRKKTFCRTARLIGAAKPPASAVSSFVKSEIADSIGDPFAFMSSLFRTVRYGLETMGFNTDPALKAVGRDVGLEVAKTLSSKNQKGLELELSEFWGRHKLGKMSFPKKNPLTVRVCGCVGSRNSPNTGKTACALSEGILESIFAGRLGWKCSVKEVKCHSTGYPYCEFVVVSQE